MRALIEWVSKEDGGRNLPPTGDGPPPYYSPEIRLPDEPWPAGVGWSATVRKVSQSSLTGQWLADVEFRVAEAPHETLREGREFELYEGNRCVARGRIINELVDRDASGSELLD